MIEKTARLILRFHKALIAGVLLLTAILFFWFAKAELGASLAGLMPPRTDPEYLFLDRTFEDFGSEYILLIAITHDRLFSPPTLSKIQKLTSEISARPYVDRVLSLTNANIVKSKGEEIYVQSISDKMPATEQEIEEFRKDIVEDPIYGGELISDDQKTALIVVYFEELAPERKTREKMLRGSVKDIQDMALAASGPEEIDITGFPAISAKIYKLMTSDLYAFVPMAVALIALILYFNFRSWWCILISLVSISAAIVWTYASMALFKCPIGILTTLVPPVIAALGTSYSVHLFTEYFRQGALENDSKRVVKNTIKNILLAIWLSALTTAIGFASLTVLDIEATREFGTFLVISVISLFLLISFFIPSVLILIKPRPRPTPAVHPQLAERSSSSVAHWIVRQRYWVMAISALAAISCLSGLMKLDVNSELLKLFKPSEPIRKSTELLAERLGGSATFSLIIEADKNMGMEDPKLLKSMEQLQSFLDRQPRVGETTSVIDYIKSTNKALHNNDPHYHVLPQSKDEVSQYLFAYSLADSQRILDNYIDYNHRVAKIDIRTSFDDSKSALQFKRLVEEECSKLNVRSCRLTSEHTLVAISTQKISQGILWSFGIAVLAISAVMFVLFRSIKIGVVAMIPNLLPLLVVLAIMGWLGISFNVTTSIIVCVAIGIAVDDTIHFLTRYFHGLKKTNHYLIRRYTGARITVDQIRTIGTTFNRVRRPVILTSMAIFFGFSVLAFSQFVPVMHLGSLIALTMVFCLLGDLILLPALLASIEI